jgi:hypothetical protein
MSALVHSGLESDIAALPEGANNGRMSHSITSSAVASIAADTVRPSA